MDGIKQTVEAAGGSMKDGVQLFIFRARPRMGDIGKGSFVVAETFKPYNVKPATTKLAVLEPGEPEQAGGDPGVRGDRLVAARQSHETTDP